MQIGTCKRISAAVPVTSDKRWPRLKASFSSSTGTDGVVVVVVVVDVIGRTSVASIQPQVTLDASGMDPGRDREQINRRHRPRPSHEVHAVQCLITTALSPPLPPMDHDDRRAASRSARSNVSARLLYSDEPSQIMALAHLSPTVNHRRRIPRSCHRRDWMKERACIAVVVVDHHHGGPDHNRLCSCSCVLLSVI